MEETGPCAHVGTVHQPAMQRLDAAWCVCSERLTGSRKFWSAGDVCDGVVSSLSNRGGRAGVLEGVLVRRIVCDNA